MYFREFSILMLVAFFVKFLLVGDLLLFNVSF